MATSAAVPDAATTAAAHPNSSNPDHYTGVVVIHGLGDIKRSATLEEVVNTLAYWFNHQAGLALRREGPGRVWVSAKLTDDPNPDERASRASIRLAAPKEPAAPADGDAGLRLEFREVWWAASFGLPSIGATIAWARVQAWEQATHLLFPIGRRLGPAHTAARAPAREVPQALTYRPMPADRIPTPPQPGGPASEVDGAHASVTRLQRLQRLQRLLLTAALGLYGLVQYVWKALQWLMLTPLLLALLLVMGPIRLLALIPPLRSSVVASLSSALDYFMLHWIAEAQVYTQDYIRSSGIRERFEQEVAELLRETPCDRLVVIAHSMGTVIAYEGLTTVLEHTEFRNSQKPITFICLAQALRRVWLMTADDPHRVRGTLPQRVRWLHFWARYDPVSAGPLSARSLPRGDAWPDGSDGPTGDGPDPHAALRARLERCENVDVVNTDSAFIDHTTYWQNLEQVVGPIARELVTGHPELEQVVAAHLATPDDILLRRWRVAWRATVALLAGLGLGLTLLLWDANQRWMRVGHTLATSFLKFLGDLLGAVVTGLGAVLSDLQHIEQGIVGGTGLPVSVDLGFLRVLPADAIWSFVAALAVAGGSILLVGKVIAPRSPLVFEVGVPASVGGAWSLLAFSAAYLALPIAVSVPLAAAGYTDPGAIPLSQVALLQFYTTGIYLGLLCGAVALVLAITASARRRLSGWETVIVLWTAPSALALLFRFFTPYSPYVTIFYNTFYSFNTLYSVVLGRIGLACIALGAVGCFLYLRAIARSRRLGGFAFLYVLLIELVLVYSMASYTLYNLSGILTFYNLPGIPASIFHDLGVFFSPLSASDEIGVVVILMPVLLFALVNGAGALGIRRAALARGEDIVSLSVATLALLIAGPLLGEVFRSSRHEVAVIALVAYTGAVLTSLFALRRAVVHAVRDHRYGWLGAMFLIMIFVFSSNGFELPYSTFYPPFDAPLFLTRMLGMSAGAAALTYGLWGGVTQGRQESRGKGPS